MWGNEPDVDDHGVCLDVLSCGCLVFWFLDHSFKRLAFFGVWMQGFLPDVGSATWRRETDRRKEQRKCRQAQTDQEWALLDLFVWV